MADDVDPQPITLKHPKIDTLYVAPSQEVADVLADSGWKPAPKSEQHPAAVPGPVVTL